MCVFGSVKQKELVVAVVVLGSDSVWKIYWVAAVKKKTKTSRQHVQSQRRMVLLSAVCQK